MRIAVNKAHYPVSVLGWGRRIGIWLQGCTIHCPGCVSQDTWAHDPEREIPVARLVDWCREIAAGGIDGITISGGEPFEQSEALDELLTSLRQWTDTLPEPVDYLCYSGLPIRILQERHAVILNRLDAIIPEPFVHTLPAKELRGSSNQSMIALTSLGEIRYAQAIVDDTPVRKRFQVAVDHESVWFIGIPARQDMERMTDYCKDKGVFLNKVSWRA